MKKSVVLLVILVALSVFLTSCGNETGINSEETINKDNLREQDLSGYNAYGQEMRIDYGFAWKPSQPDGYVGDVMPYYENGVYSLFYLKDEGGSIRHSVYRVDTRDFIDYEDKGLVLASRSVTKQDYWIGTGSVVKAEEDYYLFYTGFNNTLDVWEKVMVAKSVGNMDNFVRIEDFYIAPPAQYSQRDFRDPQVYYNETEKKFDMTVESNYGGKARIVKYSISLDLKNVSYEGDMYVDNDYHFWNLECADIFEHNGKYYLTYSAQGNPMDTVWIAESDNMFSGYVNHRRIEGLHYYAAKTVVGDNGIYLIGWLYRRQDSKLSCSDEAGLYWGGHIVVHKIEFDEDGNPYLAPISGFKEYYGAEGETLSSGAIVFSRGSVSETKVANGAESYMLTGDFTFIGTEKFGLVLGYNDTYKRYVSFNPAAERVEFTLKSNTKTEAQMSVSLNEGEKYSFVYVQEGSVGLFYIVGKVGFSFRVHGINNKIIGIYSKGSSVSFENMKYYLRVKR